VTEAVDRVTRGSRKHVLDWTGRPSCLSELAELLAPVPVRIPRGTTPMPCGPDAPMEARLERHGQRWLPGHPAWRVLQDWWLVHKAGANTPNWDIAVGCELEGRPGLVLVEAKANHRELKAGGKPLRADASLKARANHERIGAAIVEACVGWRLVDARVTITRDAHYQLVNRLAFTWKLATLGIPVALVYLGFAGDEGIRDAGTPFADDADWQAAFREHLRDHHGREIVPLDLLERRLEVLSPATDDPVPVWLLSRSRPVIEVSPPRGSLRQTPPTL